LSIELSGKILAALEKHGEFLVDVNHYEPEHNHGINEAAALYLLSESFPTLEHAKIWNELGRNRLQNSLDALVDSDGVLVENSPFYHFYTLEKYWEIFKYSETFGTEISSNIKEKIEKMIEYGTYIVQPNGDIPLMGASMERNLKLGGIYGDIAKNYPEFEYVLTNGERGCAEKK